MKKHKLVKHPISWALLSNCFLLSLLPFVLESIGRSGLNASLDSYGDFRISLYSVAFIMLVVIAAQGHSLIQLTAHISRYVFLGLVLLCLFKACLAPHRTEPFFMLPLLVIAIPLMLYSCAGTGFRGLFFCGLGALVLIALAATTGSFFSVLTIAVIAMGLLCYSAYLKWFGWEKHYFFASIGATLVMMCVLVQYKWDKFSYYLYTLLYPGFYFDDYHSALMQSLLRESRWFGQGDLAISLENATQCPYYDTDFLAYLSNHYGLWILVGVAALFLGFFYLCLSKVQPVITMPTLLSLSIIGYLMLQTIAFFAHNMGFPWFTGVPLPFVSYSSYILGNGVLCGLLISALSIRSSAFDWYSKEEPFIEDGDMT